DSGSGGWRQVFAPLATIPGALLHQSRYSLIPEHWPNRPALLADRSACYPRYKLENRTAGGSMRFGFFDQLPCAPGYSEQQRYRDIIAQIELGEEIGFDTVWLRGLRFSRRV